MPVRSQLASAGIRFAVFMRGAVARGKAPEIFNMSERSARRVVSGLLEEGLLQSSSQRAPLTIGVPTCSPPDYFPDLYDPSVIGEQYTPIPTSGPTPG
jgi:hypothetical protein